MTPSQKEGIEMIEHKLCRILCGDPNFRDHWQDIAGYAMRVLEEIDRSKATSRTRTSRPRWRRNQEALISDNDPSSPDHQKD
jgi:hypothetical protein